MNLIIIHENRGRTARSGDNLLRSALSSAPVATIILDSLKDGSFFRRGNGKVLCAIPKEWGTEHLASEPDIIAYTKNVPICFDLTRRTKQNAWTAFSNGRFATQINGGLLENVLATTEADVLAVNAKPELMAGHEKVRLTAKNKVAGFRRFYSDSAEPAPIPVDWPHYIFIRPMLLREFWQSELCPDLFPSFYRGAGQTH